MEVAGSDKRTSLLQNEICKFYKLVPGDIERPQKFKMLLLLSFSLLRLRYIFKYWFNPTNISGWCLQIRNNKLVCLSQTDTTFSATPEKYNTWYNSKKTMHHCHDFSVC